MHLAQEPTARHCRRRGRGSGEDAAPVCAGVDGRTHCRRRIVRCTADSTCTGVTIPARKARERLSTLHHVSRGCARNQSLHLARSGRMWILSRWGHKEENILAAARRTSPWKPSLHASGARPRGHVEDSRRQCTDSQLLCMSQPGWNAAHGSAERSCRPMLQLSWIEGTSLRRVKSGMREVSRATY